MRGSLVVMGVAGCGKSSLAKALADALGWELVEGDEFHSAGSRAKMVRGVPLDDEDRADWLQLLAHKLGDAPHGTVLTCSALKRAYREQLRSAAPGLRFVFLRIDRDVASMRVAGRGSHFFSPELVSSQFAALEDPSGEPRVLALDACAPLDALLQTAVRWTGNPV
jgi:gluconokinase